MNLTWMERSVLGTAWLVLALAAIPAFAQETKNVVAYSMRVAETQVQAAERQGMDFRRERPDLVQLGGITTPWAIVIDPSTADWILVGERDAKAPALTLDDWVVALRARFFHVEADPGVTIDRRPSERCLREGLTAACLDASRQDVRFFAGIANSRFGHVCLDADRLMKRIGLGLEAAPVKGLKTYRQLASAELRRADGRRQTTIASRFWFYPTIDRVNVFEDVVFLGNFRVTIFTEVLQMAIDGKPVPDAPAISDRPSEAFSRSLNEHFDALAAARPVLDTLRGLTRLAALAKGLNQGDVPVPGGYFLDRYPVQPRETPTEHEVVSAQGMAPGVQLSGGVAVAALVSRDNDGDAGSFKRLVLAARPSEAALSWSVAVPLRAGRPEGLKRASTVSDAGQISELFSRALFLQQTKRDDDAIALYGRVLALAPDRLVSVQLLRGQAYAHKGRYDLAIADYDREIALNPKLAVAYTSRGAARGMSGDQDRAIADYDTAVALNAKFAVAYNNRGVAHNLKREYARAVKDFDQALALDPALALAYLNRGIALVGEDPESPIAWSRARADFDRTLGLDPLNASAYYWRGLASAETYDQASADLDVAVALDPGLASAVYQAKAELADQAGRTKDAEAVRARLRELGQRR
jgi:tetratricopeptide (TPR) repeat protein